MASASSIRSWLDAGLSAHRSGDIPRAVDAYRHALALAPDDGDALNLLGTALLQQGEPAAAVATLERAAGRRRNDPRVLANLAQAYLACARPAEAAGAFRKASRIAPQELHFQLGLAAALAMQGDFTQATLLLKRLSQRHPQSPDVWFNLGNALRDQRQPEEAISAYREAVALEPRHADAVNNLGSMHQSTLRFAEAEAFYRQCLEIAPDHLLARYNLASVVIDLGRFAEAEAISRELVARAPNTSSAHTILGAAVGHQGRLLEARECHERAVRLTPGDAKAVEIYAATLMETGRVAQGLRWFRRALSLDPQGDAVRQVLGTSLLANGYLQEGWIEYGRRPAALRFREKYAGFSLARTLPQDLHGKHICVLREQGLGDEIFLLRYAAVLTARGARVTYRSSEKIASLLQRVPFIATTVAEVAELPPADANILLGDLPHALDPFPASVLPSAPSLAGAALPDYSHQVCVYWPPLPKSIELRPLAVHVDALRERLASLGPPPYIGITWRAGTLPEDQSSVTWLLYKTIGVEALARTLIHANGTIIALQRKPSAGELERLATALGRPVHDLTALNEDLEEMLALLDLLDDYVGVSNTNVHLRAALGKTARILVPVPAEWRWRASGSSTPWFPGFSIYRQSLQGDWQPALAALARDLTLNYPPHARSNSA